MKMAQVAYFDSELNAVEATLKVLLPSIDAASYSVKLDNRVLKLQGQQQVLENIKDQLVIALDSPEAIRSTLNYHLSGSKIRTGATGSISRAAIADTPSQPEDSVQSGIACLNRLFPGSLGDGFHFVPAEIFSEKDGAHSKEGVLFSKETKVHVFKQLWELCVARMLELFNDVPVSDIRELWEGKILPSTEMSTPDLAEDSVASGLLLECFGTVDNAETNTKRIYFNYLKLYQLLYPPKVILQEAGQLTISLEHLVIYLKQCVREGFLLSIDHKSLSAAPLFFENRETISAPLDLLFILDVSGSMSGFEREYVQTISNLLNKVRVALGTENTLKAKVSFKLFAGTTLPMVQYNLNNSAAILSYLKTISCCYDSTALFKAVYDGLEHAQGQNGKNSVIMLLTDGINNTSPEYKSMMEQRMAQVQKNPKLQMSFFTLGLGGAVDEAVLKNLADNTASHYFPIQNLSEFSKRIEEQMTRMRFSHRVYELLFNNEQFKIPVPKNGSFSKAQLQIPFTQGKVDLKVNGDVYVATLNQSKTTQLSSDALAGMVRSRGQLSNQSQSNSDDDDSQAMNVNLVTAGIS